MYIGQELMFTINSGRFSKTHDQNIKLVFAPLNQISHGTQTANQEELQTMYHLQSYKKDKILQVLWDVGHSQQSWENITLEQLSSPCIDPVKDR